MECVPIEDSDQPAHPCSLIKVFDGLSMGSQGSKVSSGGKLRLIRLCRFADGLDSSLYGHANLYLIMLDTGSNNVFGQILDI